MPEALFWLALDREVSHWFRAGRRPALWWRDDDARRPGPALDRLVRLSEEARWPLLLAIIPDDDLDGLADLCCRTTTIVPAQHGATHANNAPSGAPPAEVPEGEALSVSLARLKPALDRMYAAALSPQAYVPPWNQASAPLPDAVTAMGVERLSAFGGLSSDDGRLHRLDTHVDLLRWRGGARFRGARRVLDRLRRELERRRVRGLWREPVGLLTHHLDHDAATWDFLGRFLRKAPERFDLLSPIQAFDRANRAPP